MKIEYMEQQKNKLLVDKGAPDLNGMLCSVCQKIALSVWGYHPAPKRYKDTMHYAIYSNVLLKPTYNPV